MVNNWPVVSLGEVLEIKYGKDHKKLKEGQTPCYGSGGIMRYVDEYLYNDQSILIPRKGSLNNIFYIDEPFWTVDTLFWSKTDKTLADPKFIYYQLKLVDFNRLNEGSAVPSMTVPILNNIKVKLPPIKTQKDVSKVLSNFDEKIELNRQTNQTLEQMAQALFKSWFVDFDPVFDNALASGMAVNDFPEALQKKALARQTFIQAKKQTQAKQQHQQTPVTQPLAKQQKPKAKPLPESTNTNEHWHQLFPSEFEQTNEPSIGINGWVPKGWGLSNTDEEFGIKGGSTPSTKNPVFWEDGEIYWTSPKDLSGNDSKILLETSRKITEAGLAKITSGLLPVDTVLMSSRAPVGYLALAKVPIAINQGYIALGCEKTLSPEYAIQFLDSIMDEIKGISGGTTFAEISKKTFRSIKLIIPSKSVIDVYSSIAKAQYDKITENIKQSSTLTDTRDYLLPKLISGEVQLDDTNTV